MQTPFKLIYGLIFLLFLPLGIWAGLSLGELGGLGELGEDEVIRAALSGGQAITPLPTPATGQRNVLIIGVDRLSLRTAAAAPRLESIWLAAYLPGQPFVTLIPIYPAISGKEESGGDPLGEIFQLDPDGAPGDKLLNRLRQKQIWWNGYVVLDEIAMMEIVDYLGGIPLQERRLSGAIALGEIPRPWEDPVAALQGQTTLLERLCRRAAYLPPDPDLRRISNLIPAHLHTNLDATQVMREWQILLSGKSNLDCEFPLSDALPLPEV